MSNDNWGDFKASREWGGRAVIHVMTGLVGVGLVLMMLGGVIDTMVMTVIVLSVSLSVLFGDHFRLWTQKVQMPSWWRLFEERILQRYIFRDTEGDSPCAVGLVTVGFVVAWISTTVWEENTLWIFVLVCLLFSLVDFCAKFGWRWPIKRFQTGWKKDKSWGGLLYGFLAGVFSMGVVLALNQWVIIIFPSGLGWWQIALTYAVGTVSASLLELYTGKWDNFVIPAGSAILMNFAYLIISLFSL